MNATLKQERWTYDPDDDFHNAGGQAFVCDEEGKTVCVVEGGRKDRAALVSAAPDLLEACKAALLKFDYFDYSPLDRVSIAGDMLRAAIEKATR